jgi:DNA-directed RNA polymerase specialized sigma24 family protein
LDPDPDPAFAALLEEECQRLLGLLDHGELQRVALLKMEGYTVEEIAAQLGRVPRTVKRRLQLIRQIWEKELPASWIPGRLRGGKLLKVSERQHFAIKRV